MKKLFKSLGWIIILMTLTMLPSLVQIGNESLMEWQRERIGWNYIGVSANILLFFIYTMYSKKDLSHFGFQLGKIKEHVLWLVCVGVIFIGSMRMVAYVTEGPLIFQIPLWTTIIFQLIFVAFSEEMFWRGFIQTEFGLWIATIGFGAMHVIPQILLSLATGTPMGLLSGIAHMVFASCLGLLFGFVRKKTDSIYAPILLHGLYGLSNHMIVATGMHL